MKKTKQRTNAVSQKIRPWQRGLISVHRAAWVSHREMENPRSLAGTSQIEHKPFQLIRTWMELGRTPCQRPYCKTTPASSCQWAFVGERIPSTHGRCHAQASFPLQTNVSTRERRLIGWIFMMLWLGLDLILSSLFLACVFPFPPIPEPCSLLVWFRPLPWLSVSALICFT